MEVYNALIAMKKGSNNSLTLASSLWVNSICIYGMYVCFFVGKFASVLCAVQVFVKKPACAPWNWVGTEIGAKFFHNLVWDLKYNWEAGS